MIVQPKKEFLRERFGLDPASVKQVPSDIPGAVFIECEVISPPSQVGRTVDLYIPLEQVPAMLKATKRAAIAVRSEGMQR